MTDRELLKDAAKAAGIELDYTIRPDGMAFYHSGRNALALANGGWFAPLTNDGDALRLAVKLHMTVRCYMGTTVAQIGVPGHKNAYEEETSHADPAAATRLAITRAAAEIGKEMT